MKRINTTIGKILLVAFFGLMSSASLLAQTVKYDISAIGNPYEGCEDYLVTFRADISGTVDSVELWYKSKRAVQHNEWTVNGSLRTIARFLTAGTYNPILKVKVNGVWKDYLLSEPIKVYTNPIADFRITNDTAQCFKGNQFCFEDSSKTGKEGHKLLKWTLDVGDGKFYQKLPVCHSYNQKGDFDVVLTVTDEKGCSDSRIYKEYPEVYRQIGANFAVFGPVGCPCTDIKFVNRTPFDTALIDFWIWDWGTGGRKAKDTFYMRGENSLRINAKGDTLVDYEENWTDFTREYCQDGYSSPKLVIVANDGCRDSLLLKDAIRSIAFRFDITWVPDTPCFTDNSIKFNMPPRPNATQLQWTFGDPASMLLNVNRESWRPDHVFVGGPGFYNVNFAVLEQPCPVQDTTICFVKLKGPAAAINLPPPPAFNPHNCTDPREIPRDTFERLKYDECYRETSMREELNFVWVTSNAKSKRDSYFVYCNAEVDSFMFTPGASGGEEITCGPPYTIAKNDGWVAKDIFKKVYKNATPWSWSRDDFAPSGVTIWLRDGDSREYIDMDTIKQTLTSNYDTFYFVHCREFNFLKGDSIPRNPIVMDSMAVFESPKGPNNPIIAGTNGFVKDKTFTHKWAGLVHYFKSGESRRYISLDGDTLTYIATKDGFDTLYVSEFEFYAGDTIQYPNGNWRYHYNTYTQSFRPAWNYKDAIPVPEKLKITGLLTPLGGGTKVQETFEIYPPYMRMHEVEVKGKKYIYRVTSSPIKHAGGQYYPPMWQGNLPGCTNEWRQMHDSDKFKFDCKAPNLVTFTNNTTKYRLFGSKRSELPTHPDHDYDNKSMAFYGNGVVNVDSCKTNPNFPFASDSLEYFWEFGDNGDACTTYYDANRKIAVKGLNPTGDPLQCRFSELAAPQHLYVEDGCWTAILKVYDPVTNCESQASQPIVMEFPDAGPDNPLGVLDVGDVNFYNQQVIQKNEDDDEFRKGLQLGVSGAPCVGNAANPYFQNIDIAETVPLCGRETFWMIFNRDDPHQGKNDDLSDNDCVKNECNTDGNGKLVENSLFIKDRGSLHTPGTYDVEFREVLGPIGTQKWGKTYAVGRATITILGYLDNVVVTDQQGGFSDKSTIQMVFSDSSLIGFGPGRDSILVYGYEEIDTFWYECEWIPELILQLIGMRWSYTTAGCKTPGLRIKVGDCFHTYFYENYRYFLDANGNFQLSPNPRTLLIEEETSDRDDVSRIRKDIVNDVEFVTCKTPTDSTLLPSKLPYRMILSVEDYERNDPAGANAHPVCDALDSIRTFKFFASRMSDQCGTYNGSFGAMEDSLDLMPYGYKPRDSGNVTLVNLRDTLHYTIRKAGKYLISSSARAKHNANFCFGAAAKEIWVGQIQCFRYTDSVLCEGQEVTFYDSVYYWDRGGNIVCELNGTSGWNTTCIDLEGYFYNPDSNATRKNWYNGGALGGNWYKAPDFKEGIAWDFDAPRYVKDRNGKDSTDNFGNKIRMQEWMRTMDSSNIDVWIEPGLNQQTTFLPNGDTVITNPTIDPLELALDSNSWKRGVTWQYGTVPKYGVGIYDVTLWARDSMGCWIPYTKMDAIRVLGVEARFSLDALSNDTLICTPSTAGFLDSSIVIENKEDVPLGYSVGKGKNDEVVKWKWKWGDKRDSSFLQNPGHTYLDANEKGYTVRLFVETAQGCKDSITAPFFIKVLGPRADFNVLTDSICLGDTLELVDKSYSRADYTSVWTTDPLASTKNDIGKGSTVARNDTVGFFIPDTGVFKLYLQISSKVKDPLTGVEKDCDDKYPNPKDPREKDIFVYIRGLDKIAINASDILICPNEEIIYTVDNENTYYKYDSLIWNTGVGEEDQLKLRTEEVKQVYTEPGKYRVNLTGTGRWMTCPDTTSIQIVVKDVLADVEIDEANSNEDLGNYVFLNNSQNAVYHRWRIYLLPDTVNAIAEFIKTDTSRLVYNEFTSGEYKIELTVSDYENPNDPKACIDVDFVKIKVEPKIVVYNIFSPDGDGKNDWWEMELQAVPEFELYIYNRWGELMLKGDQDSEFEKYQKESTGTQVYKFWDGTNRIAGGRATAGTYFYVFKYRFKGDEELETITGSITLVR